VSGKLCIVVDWSTIISTAIGVILGGIITAFFSWRATKELRSEANRLRQYNTALLRLLDPSIEGVATVEGGGDPIVVREGSIEQWLLNEAIRIRDEQEEPRRRRWWRNPFGSR